MSLHNMNKNGFTLVEVMIAVLIGFILIAAVSATYVAQNRSFVVQESVSEVNTQSKIAHDMIANDIRSAGFGIPEDLNVDPVNGYTTIITPVDSNATYDAVTIVGGFRMLGRLVPAGGAAGCPTVVPLSSTIVNIVYAGTETFDTADRRFISIDGIHFANVVAITVTGDNVTLTLDRPLTQDFPVDAGCVGRPVYLVEDTTFCVDANMALHRIRGNANVAACADAGAMPANDEIIAENIEDLQFAYTVDANSDGQIDDQPPLNGIINGNDYINATAIADFSTIRGIRVNVLAQADRIDTNFQGQGNPPARIENRPHNPTNDALRRRWWQTMIKIRNQ